MKIRPFVVVIAVSVTAPLLTGCLETITDVECLPVPITISEVSGDTTITSTGLAYIDGEEGAGDEVDWCQEVTIHYTGSLLDGTEFDSSRVIDLPLPFTPGLGGLIEGLEQGVIGMRAGATRRLIIPPDLGFGEIPRHNELGEVVVPGNSTVVYDIEVLEIADP